MIWTEGWINAIHEGPTDNHFSIEEHHATRVEILWRYRLRLARMEAEAWRAWLDEERLVADTVIRSMHMRIDNAERIVEAAREVCRCIVPGLPHYVRITTPVVRLVELIAERDRHQFAPHATNEAERAAIASTPTEGA